MRNLSKSLGGRLCKATLHEAAVGIEPPYPVVPDRRASQHLSSLDARCKFACLNRYSSLGAPIASRPSGSSASRVVFTSPTKPRARHERAMTLRRLRARRRSNRR